MQFFSQGRLHRGDRAERVRHVSVSVGGEAGPATASAGHAGAAEPVRPRTHIIVTQTYQLICIPVKNAIYTYHTKHIAL